MLVLFPEEIGNLPVKEVVVGLADNLVPGPADELDEGGVTAQVNPLGILEEDDVRDGIQQGIDQGRLPPDLFLRAPHPCKRALDFAALGVYSVRHVSRSHSTSARLANVEAGP